MKFNNKLALELTLEDFDNFVKENKICKEQYKEDITEAKEVLTEEISKIKSGDNWYQFCKRFSFRCKAKYTPIMYDAILFK